MDSNLMIGLTFFLSLVALAFLMLYLVERGKSNLSKEKPSKPKIEKSWDTPSYYVERTITSDVVTNARDKLRVLDLEREILSYAVRRLYEASIEGKITEVERDRLTLKYKIDLQRIKEEIARGESIVALNELERMQEDFVNLFSERFDKLNEKIEELRTISGIALRKPSVIDEKYETDEEDVKTEDEETIVNVKDPETSIDESITETQKKKKRLLKENKDEKQESSVESQKLEKQKKRKSKPFTKPEKTDAEKKVEQIVADVEKVLERLGQMEVDE